LAGFWEQIGPASSLDHSGLSGGLRSPKGKQPWPVRDGDLSSARSAFGGIYGEQGVAGQAFYDGIGKKETIAGAVAAHRQPELMRQSQKHSVLPSGLVQLARGWSPNADTTRSAVAYGWASLIDCIVFIFLDLG
jgi:hypothetical protein